MRGGRAIAALATMLLCAGTVADPASANGPVKVGWWNAISAGGVSAPQPTTAASDLHVGQGPTGSTAIAAVDYALARQLDVRAVLELKVRSGSNVGTAALVACPTKDRGWKVADNGPMSAAPSYDCRLSVPGLVSADGDTVTFLLDQAQSLAGGYSLAVVPAVDAAPFQVDLVKPGMVSLTFTDAQLSPQAAETPPVEAAIPVGGPAALPTLSAAPASSSPPVVAAPQVALPSASPPSLAEAEAVAATALKRVRSDRFLAGSLLAIFAGAFTWLLQQRSVPLRLLGGAARTSRSPPGPVESDGPLRGIGRYVSVRTRPARKLI